MVFHSYPLSQWLFSLQFSIKKEVTLREGRKMKHRSYHFIVPAFIVILLCIRTRSEAEPLESSVNISTLGCTGTVAECLDQNEEFQLDSHESRRILLNKPIDISLALMADKPFCDKTKAADCLPRRNGNPKDTCQIYDRCRAST